MEARCDTCELVQRKFYCTECLRTHIRDFRSSSRRTASERDAELAKANKTLTVIQSGRLLRADQARLQDSVTEIVKETKDIRERIARLLTDQSTSFHAPVKSQITTKRTALQSRRTNTHLAKTHVLPDLTSHQAELVSQIKTVRSRLASTDTALATTRKVLIKNLVEAFDLREASLAPPQPKQQQQSSYGGGAFKSSSPTSAVFQHSASARGGSPGNTSSLPFATASYIAGAGKAFFGRTGMMSSVIGQGFGGGFGMGGGSSGGGAGAGAMDNRRPLPAGKREWSIAGLVLPVAGDLRRRAENKRSYAGYQSEHLTAAVAHTLHFLRLLTFYLGVKLPFEVYWSSGIPGIGQPTIVAGRGSEKNGWVNMITPFPLYLTSSDPPTSDQLTPGSPSSAQPSSATSDSSKPTLDAFTTALCMLNYNIAYLSHTQGLEVPLSVAGETLRNLWAVCCINSDAFARASHTTPSFQAPLLPPPTESKTFGLEFAQLLQATSPRTASAIASRHSRKSSSTSRATVKTGLGGGANDEWDLIEIEEGEEGVG
ncbi:hypothetical protein FRB90_010661 [Tulasnella sp. 427]|nr:hypothetical protein FRB90_010661 [Tulasnella sp. 427]